MGRNLFCVHSKKYIDIEEDKVTTRTLALPPTPTPTLSPTLTLTLTLPLTPTLTLTRLDNVMANAGEVALCLHTDGVVQGYRLLRTDALPSPGALGEGFSPAAVTQRAVSVLRVLR